MKRCWHGDSTKKPSITEIHKNLGHWYFQNDYVEQFNQAEQKRLESIRLKELGPEFSEKPHLKAIFTSRPLRSLISKSSSINSTSMISFRYVVIMFFFIKKQIQFIILDNMVKI